MMEILIDLIRGPGGGEIDVGQGGLGLDMVGDILIAKVSPAVWGSEEKRLFLITYHDDPAIEAAIPEGSHADLPYEIVESIEQPDGTFVPHTITRSKYRVNLDMFTDSAGLDPEDTTSEPVEPNDVPNLVIADLIFDDSERFPA